MASPRRRSARLKQSAQQQRASPRKAANSLQLYSLVERDETPDFVELQPLDEVLATPASSTTAKSHLSRLSSVKTPRTEPRVDIGEMHPEILHHSTAKAPDSGLKLGFVDLPAQPPQSLASAQNTPSKARSNIPSNLASTTFDFKFGSESQLSSEAQKLMDNVRVEAARIKAQMQAERDAQQKKDEEAEAALGSTNSLGRKIAKPKGKAGRFSDIHMAQFKKMDSIANHPSAYRSRPGFSQPTVQSLKRTPSKAGLDEPDRPRTAGKSTPGRQPPPFQGRPTSVSPFKSIPPQPTRAEATGTTKRARRSELHDVSAGRKTEQHSMSPAIPKHVPSSLLSPTKASLAKVTSSQLPVASPKKVSTLVRTSSSLAAARPWTSNGPVDRKGVSSSVSQIGDAGEAVFNGVTVTAQTGIQERPKSAVELPASPNRLGFASKLPTFAGLRSILRTGRKSTAATLIEDRPGTPKRPNSATSVQGSGKKVDFTPSVKSRYAVKLAAASPSPAKLPHLTPGKILSPAVPYDPAAFLIQSDEEADEWEDAESEIEYPTLPEMISGPVASKPNTPFKEKATDHNRRESKEFKSIFTTLHHPSRSNSSSTLTSVNTIVNQTNPTTHANKILRSPGNMNFSKPSPNTIRRVRTSGVSELVQPFEDTEVKTVPHGLSGKKRRRESKTSDESDNNLESSKENRRRSALRPVPGGWRDSYKTDEEPDESLVRSGKRLRVTSTDNLSHKAPIAEKLNRAPSKSRPSSARELAKTNAKERKGILSLSRLHMLSRPKQRG